MSLNLSFFTGVFHWQDLEARGIRTIFFQWQWHCSPESAAEGWPWNKVSWQWQGISQHTKDMIQCPLHYKRNCISNVKNLFRFHEDVLYNVHYSLFHWYTVSLKDLMWQSTSNPLFTLFVYGLGSGLAQKSCPCVCRALVSHTRTFRIVPSLAGDPRHL